MAIGSICTALAGTETKSPDDPSDCQQFLRDTYGVLRDTPVQRWDQGEYEARESLE